MSSLNQVNIIGRVGQDPEVKLIPSGDAVCNLSVATSEKWKDKASGQQKERSEWHRIVFFGKLAEIVGQYAKKGTLIYIQGKLETREWEKDGIKRYTTEIRAHEMKLLSGKSDDATPRQQQNRPPQQQAQAPQQDNKYDNDIPF